MEKSLLVSGIRGLKLGDVKEVKTAKGSFFTGRILFNGAYYSCIITPSQHVGGLWDINISLPSYDTYGMKKAFREGMEGGGNQAEEAPVEEF